MLLFSCFAVFHNNFHYKAMRRVEGKFLCGRGAYRLSDYLDICCYATCRVLPYTVFFSNTFVEELDRKICSRPMYVCV